MEIRFANDEEIRNWDNLILKNPDGGNVFQSFEMTEFKRKSGWQPRYFLIENFDSERVLAISAQEKLVLGLGKLWYLSKGAGISNRAELQKIKEILRNFGRKNGVFAIKMESELLKNAENLSFLKSENFEIVRPIQPNFSTILLDISPSLSEEEILAKMPRKGAKYSINRAKRDGVEVERVDLTRANAQIFYDLLAETARDSGFNIRSFEYHFEFWQSFSKAQIGQLFFAKFEGEVVAAAFAFVFGEKSTYKDGASVRARKAYGASHLLQWEVIRWARENGAKIHDLCGTPPSDQIHDKNHFLHGVGQFKTSFSKEITDYVGAFDLVISPKKYQLWRNFGEKLLLKINRKIFQRNWY
ncbi:MAG: peptidoglycan bridge formation glycyltransferase FemA/FemB family protein [bacterium]|nr:peptidoglycan bridge formation glycyltransferase FemA/FemB family protein [bacterium]